MTNECADVIETNIIFATEVKVNVKVRKVTRYGSTQPEYDLIEIAGIHMGADVLDLEVNKDIVMVIKGEALKAIKNAEKRLKDD